MLSLILASVITLTPGKYDGIGVIEGAAAACRFEIPAESELNPITRLNMVPFTEEYGEGDLAPEPSTCLCDKTCVVTHIYMDGPTNTIKIYCNTDREEE